VRQLYPSTSRFARRGIADRIGRVPLPRVPTSAPPGSEAKVRVLMARASKRQGLWHPADAPMDVESRKLGVA